MARSRWRRFTRDWIAQEKGDSLDIAWLKDDSVEDAADLPELPLDPAILLMLGGLGDIGEAGE